MVNYVTRSDDSLSLLFLRCKTRLCVRSSRKWWQQWKKSASSQSLLKIKKKKYITEKQKPEKVLNINRDNLGFSAAVRSASLSHKANVFLIGAMPRLPSPLPLFWDSLNQTVAFSTCEKDEKCQTDRRKDENVRPWNAPQFFSDLQEDFFFFRLPVGAIAYVYFRDKLHQIQSWDTSTAPALAPAPPPATQLNVFSKNANVSVNFHLLRNRFVRFKIIGI